MYRQQLGKQLSIFDFFDGREFKNISTEEAKEIQKQEENHQKRLIDDFIAKASPLEKIICEKFYYSLERDIDFVKRKVKIIASTKCYHFGDMEKGMFVYSLQDVEFERAILVFENKNHWLICDSMKKDCSIDDYISGKELIGFPACYCYVYDKSGNRIEQYSYYDSKKDIRHIVCIDEWKMDIYSKENRVEKDKTKKPKDYYEVYFDFRDMVDFFQGKAK